MQQTAEVLPLTTIGTYLGPATVVEDEKSDGTAQVHWQTTGVDNSCFARIAISRLSPLKKGDEVLITSQSLSEAYITGIFSKPESSNKLEVKGAYAKSVKNTRSTTEESLQVYSSTHELLFSYNPQTQTSMVNIPKGNLELNTAQGDINLNAANKIKLNGKSLEMDANKLKLNVGFANLVFERLETSTNTLIENAKNVFRNVKQLTQLRSGRMRTLVDETYHFKANKALLKAEEDYKIKAEKINLG